MSNPASEILDNYVELKYNKNEENGNSELIVTTNTITTAATDENERTSLPSSPISDAYSINHLDLDENDNNNNPEVESTFQNIEEASTYCLGKRALFCSIHFRNNNNKVWEVSTPYFIEKSITNKVFLLKHAEAVKQFNIQNISNNCFDQGEFDRWRITMKVAKLRMPSFEDIQKKQLQIKDANEHNLTHQEVDEMVKIKKELRNSTFLKNLDSILHDDTLDIKLEPTDPNYRFRKAINRKMKKLEKLLYSADIDMRLVPDPRYEIVRELVETEYEKKYENFRRTIIY
ncbi:9702_t:CDS:2 [Entrophospora sp. SA101]|nr:9702_t:CDS:2 [Entrophospora sp. SA101]